MATNFKYTAFQNFYFDQHSVPSKDTLYSTEISNIRFDRFNNFCMFNSYAIKRKTYFEPFQDFLCECPQNDDQMFDSYSKQKPYK